MSIPLYIFSIVVYSYLFHKLIKKVIFRLLEQILSKQLPNVVAELKKVRFFNILAGFAPLIVTFVAIKYYPINQLTDKNIKLILGVINIGLVVFSLQMVNAVITLILNQISLKYAEVRTIIRTLHQVIKIGLAITGLIIIFSILLNKSPLVILSSLGALTAIFLLVFKDTILGFVASIQVTLLENVRVGDWVEMPKYNADGTVLDINISSIRVQNWDKTITTVPTYALISDPVKNWRGMEESKSRRIRRKIFIDLESITFLSDEDISRMTKVNQLSAYFKDIIPEIDLHNQAQINNSETLNIRRLTNIGLFRNYLNEYLKNHPKINSSTTILVRQHEQTSTGVPIEIYCFTNTTNWNEYEDIQSDIFDHIYATIHEFRLRLFQFSKFNSVSKD
ncbi:MAG: mechanosensitive ion channel domain-containing protein [Candidatus Margulisiibacteriota bacterium]